MAAYRERGPRPTPNACVRKSFIMIQCPELPLRWLAACAALSLGASARSQELMELRLTDGRVLVGVVRSQGPDYVVETRDALVRVARQDVQRQRDRRALQAALKAKVKDSDDAYFWIVSPFVERYEQAAPEWSTWQRARSE